MLHLILWRGLLAAGGSLAIWWGAITLPIFWQQADMDRVAARITEGEPFKADLLQRLLAKTQIDDNAWTRPKALRSRAIIQLRLAETEITADPTLTNAAVLKVKTAIGRALAASPADSYLWLALFWANSLNAHIPPDFDDLRMSHKVGPNEGWVAVRRVPLELAIFDDLSPDLAAAAVSNFRRLATSGYFDATVTIMERAALPLRFKLQHEVEGVPSDTLEHLSKSARGLGYIDLEFARDPAAARPWR